MPDKSQLIQATGNTDPTLNVREMFQAEIIHLKELREAEKTRVDEKFLLYDEKYQIQFNAAEKAITIALVAQEKAVAAALEGTKEAIVKNDANTDKRFDLLSEKIGGVMDTISKATGAQGVYVTHSDLSNEMEKLRVSFENMLRPVTAFMNAQQGGSKSTNMVWVYIGLAFTVLGTAAALLLNALRLAKIGL